MVQLCLLDFQVKDLNTETPILSGKVKEGVYEWSPTPSLSPFILTYPTVTKSLFSLPTSSLSSLVYNSCSSNNSHKLSFSTSTISSCGPLDVIYSDVWTSPIYLIDGFKYYVVFVDHFTCYVWLYPLRQKSQVAQIFPRFKALVENQFKTQITTLYSDNGGEYIALASLLSTSGIKHLTTLHTHRSTMVSLKEDIVILSRLALHS